MYRSEDSAGAWTQLEWLAAEQTDIAALNLYQFNRAHDGQMSLPDPVERPGDAGRQAEAADEAEAKVQAYRRRVSDREAQLKSEAEEVSNDGG